MEVSFKQTVGTSATILFGQPRRRLFLSILAKIFPGPKRGDKGPGERLAEPLLDLGGCHWPPRWSQGCLFPSRPSSSSSFPAPPLLSLHLCSLARPVMLTPSTSLLASAN